MSKDKIIITIFLVAVVAVFSYVIYDFKKLSSDQKANTKVSKQETVNKSYPTSPPPTSIPKKSATNTTNRPTVIPTEGIVYFYSSSCPYCAQVNKYLDENRIRNKLNFTEKEITQSEENKEELRIRVKECGREEGGVSVPFVWDGDGKCVSGEQGVIAFFNAKVKK